MPNLLNREEFLAALDTPGHLLLDARSPKEYKHAHIPGAVNVPLLNDEHREKVGITYKKDGREAAVIKGFELVGPLFAEIIRKVKSMGPEMTLYVYCWRGGMRSAILSWLLKMSGFNVFLLEGGYKNYRSLVLESLEVQRKMIVLGGKTGSGKTELLHHLADKGEQILDLEKLACHKGSSFGALGQLPQPTNEYFENLLHKHLSQLDPEQVLWVENESRSIGTVKIPDPLFLQMQNANVLEIEIPFGIRKERILHEYGSFPVWQLKERTARLERRLGGQRMKECLLALEENRRSVWLDYLLEYYDETYAYGMSLRDVTKSSSIQLMNTESFTDLAIRVQSMKEELFQNINV